MTEPDQIEAGNTLPLETVQQDLDQNHADPGPEPTWNETESRAGPGRLKQTQLLDNADSFNHPKGFRLIALTSGMMAVVLMVALDNYILGLFPRPRTTSASSSQPSKRRRYPASQPSFTA